MEERINGMLDFLNNQITALEQMDQSEAVRNELLKWSGTASACYRLVIDDRFLEIIHRVNRSLYPAKSGAGKARQRSGLRSQGLYAAMIQLVQPPALA